ncbi:MAG TPA: hypothetical protein VK907_10540, partial [Phnomibacter sp.]|nr:hypothetical protein [Phnomibacter sp.]
MRKKFLFFCIFLSPFYSSKGQLPSQERMMDWAKAGIREPLPTYRHIIFAGDANGQTDNAHALRAILDTLTAPTMILFGSGT